MSSRKKNVWWAILTLNQHLLSEIHAKRHVLPLRGIPDLSHPTLASVSSWSATEFTWVPCPTPETEGWTEPGQEHTASTGDCWLWSVISLFQAQMPALVPQSDPLPPPIRNVPDPNQLLQRAVMKSADRDACFQLFSHLPAKSRVAVGRGALVCARTGKHPTKISRSGASGEGGGGQSHGVLLLRSTQQHPATACWHFFRAAMRPGSEYLRWWGPGMWLDCRGRWWTRGQQQTVNSSEQHLLSAFRVLRYGRVFSHVLVLDPSHVGSKDSQPFDIVTQCCRVKNLTQELCDQVTKKNNNSQKTNFS